MSSPSEEEGQKTWEKSAARFNSKQYSEYFDPCQEAADRSLKCLRRNGGARDMCQDYFEAYRECKKQWTAQRREEKRSKGGSWFS